MAAIMVPRSPRGRVSRAEMARFMSKFVNDQTRNAGQEPRALEANSGGAPSIDAPRVCMTVEGCSQGRVTADASLWPKRRGGGGEEREKEEKGVVQMCLPFSLPLGVVMDVCACVSVCRMMIASSFAHPRSE